MLNKFLCTTMFSFGLIAVGIIPQPAQAQECNVNYEMVTKLFHPDPGSYAVWENVFGEDNQLEEYTSIVNPVDSETGAVVVGEVRKDEKSPPLLTMVKVDHRGRPMWEKFHSIENLSDVIKIQALKGGYLILANTAGGKTRGGLWLGFFDTDGALKSKKLIEDKSFDLIASDISPAVDDKGWVLAVTKSQKAGYGNKVSEQRAASVFQIDTDGNIIRERSYQAGEDSEISSVKKATFPEGKSGYIATGYITNSIGKKFGWVLRLESDGALNWQQEYGRGLNARIAAAVGYRDKYVLAFGDVRPVDAGTTGSWLMLLDSDNGNILWQRYYNGETGEHDYLARGIYVNKDSLITLMMQAKVPDSIRNTKTESDTKKGDSALVGDIEIPDRTDYVHVLTLSPRGVTLAGDAYFHGQGVSVAQLVEGPNGERIMAGNALSKASQIKPPKDPGIWDISMALAEDAAVDAAKEAAGMKGEPKPELPSGELSENAKSGLALLNKKIIAQDETKKAEEVFANQEKENQPNSANVQQKNNGKSESSESILSQNGWAVMGEAPDPYNDPCKTPLVDLPKEQ